MSSESLTDKQAELEILLPIVDEYTRYKKPEKIQIPTPVFDSSSIMSGESMFQVHELLKIEKTLQRLETQGLIKILSMFGTLDGIRVSIVDVDALLEQYKLLDESIPSKGNLPRIIYSMKTGEGKINGEGFRLYRKKDNRKLFGKLLSTPNYRLSRSEAMKVINLRTTVKDPDGINDFSKKVSKLRAGLRGLSKEHLSYQNNVLQLFADVKITDKNR